MLSHRLYSLSRWGAFFTAMIVAGKLISQEEYIRLLVGAVLVIEFTTVSFLYEKKRDFFTPGYIFLFVVGFLDFGMAPVYYSKAQLAKDSLRYIGVPDDHFSLYFTVSFFFWICVGLFLYAAKKGSCKYKYPDTVRACISKNKENTVLLLGGLFCLPLSMMREMFAILYVPVVCYFFAVYLVKRRLTVQVFLAAAGFFLILLRYGRIRYLVVEFLLPLIVIFILVYGKKKVSKSRFVRTFFVAAAVIMFYGICSEIAKLNIFYNRNYSMKETLLSLSGLWEFVYRQLYRLFGIWIRLGGNIIEHVQKNGYFYGLTYVKSVAALFDLPYISLPVISAEYIQASYAQPGLLAEGYANYGIIGAVINMVIPFAAAEFIFDRTRRRFAPEWLCLSIIPFTKVILDGGTVNSVIFGIFACFLAFFPLMPQKKVVLKI